MPEILKGDGVHYGVRLDRDTDGGLIVEVSMPHDSEFFYLSPSQVEGLITYWKREGLPENTPTR